MLWDKKRKNIFDMFNEFFDSMSEDFNLGEEFMRIEEPERKPLRNVSGFSIKIQQTPGQEPKVEVQRFGPRGMEKVEPKKVGAERPKIEIVEEPKKEIAPVDVKFEKPQVNEGKNERGNFVEIIMPEIEKLNQVSLNVFEESIEVKAVNPDKKKGYFWIVKIPSGAKRATKLWSKEKLTLLFT